MRITRPTINGQIPYAVEEAIRRTMDAADGHDTQLETLLRRFEALPVPLTLEEIRDALAARGVSPLNVTKNLGVGGGDGTGTIRTGTHAQRRATDASSLPANTLWFETDRYAFYYTVSNHWQLAGGSFNPKGELLASRPTDLGSNDVFFVFFAKDNGVTYWWSGTTWHYHDGIYVNTFANRPALGDADAGMLFSATDRGYQTWISLGVWLLLPSYGGPMSGTLVPNTKPALTVNDVGFLFSATDFDRVFRWTGATWQDAPGQPTRFQVSLFDSPPGAGWARCDGTTVVRSTSTGGTAVYTTPDIITNLRFLRGAGGVATGGVAGPSIPTGPPTSGLVQVDNNLDISTVFVGGDAHIHALTDLPYWWEGYCYVRL